MNNSRVRDLLEQHDLDGLIATSPENILYLTGYRSFQGVWNRTVRAAVVTRDPNIQTALVVGRHEVGYLFDQEIIGRSDVRPILFGVVSWAIDKSSLDEEERQIVALLDAVIASPWDAIQHALETGGATGGRIAVDQTGLPSALDRLSEQQKAYEFQPGGEDLLAVARMVKSENEIALLRRAAAINEAGLRTVLALLRELDAVDLGDAYRDTVGQFGGTVQHWIGSFGRRGAVPRHPSRQHGKSGDRFKYDAGVVVDGYCSDLGGVAQLGEPSSDEQRIYAALTAGIEAGIAFTRPGVKASQVYEVMTDAVRKASHPSFKSSFSGHGIGVEPRDYPLIAPPTPLSSRFIDNPFDPVLEEGMVINFELPAGSIGDGGFNHEVTSVVRSDGVELLSRLREYTVV